MKRFLIPVALAAVLFAITFVLGYSQQCPQGYTLIGGKCVATVLATGLAATPTLCPAGQAPTGILASGNATGCAPVLPGLANIAVGPSNSTINGTVNIVDKTPTTGATLVNIGIGAGQTASSLTFQNNGATVLATVNLINDTGAANAIAGTMPGGGVSAPSGLCVLVKLNNTLQAGANTFNLAGVGVEPILSHFSSVNIAKGYPVGFYVNLCFVGNAWLDMSQ